MWEITPKLSDLKQHLFTVSTGQECRHGLPGSSTLSLLPDCHQGVSWDCNHLLGMALLLSLLTSLLTGFNNFSSHAPLQHGSLLNQSMQAEKAIEIEDEQDKNHRLVIWYWKWYLITFHVLVVRSKSLGLARMQGERIVQEYRRQRS